MSAVRTGNGVRQWTVYFSGYALSISGFAYLSNLKFSPKYVEGNIQVEIQKLYKSIWLA